MPIYSPEVIARILGIGQAPAMPPVVSGAQEPPISQGALLGAGPEMPAAPDWATPNLLAPTDPGRSGGIAAAMAGTPDYQRKPYESAGSSFLGGLLTGGQQGYSAATLGRLKHLDEQVALKNKVESESAARTNASISMQYSEALKNKYKMAEDASKNMIVNAAMQKDFPFLNIGDSIPKSDSRSLYEKKMTRDASMVPIPNEPDLLKYMGRTFGEKATQQEILSARSGMKPSGGGGSGSFGGSFDPEAIADSIYEGRQMANPSDYSKGAWNSIASVLEKKYKAPVGQFVLAARTARQTATTMSQAQMTQYKSAINKSIPTIDYTESLVDELDKIVPSGMLRAWNRVSLGVIANGQADKLPQAFRKLSPAQVARAANLATQVIGQINGPVVGEVGVVYSRGGVPTDHAREMVLKQINADMGTSNLKAGFSSMRRDLGYANIALQEIESEGLDYNKDNPNAKPAPENVNKSKKSKGLLENTLLISKKAVDALKEFEGR